MKFFMRLCVLCAAALAIAALGACGSDDGDSTDTAAGSSASSGGDAKEVRVVHLAPPNVSPWDAMHKRAYEAVQGPSNWNVQTADGVPYGETDAVLSRWGDQEVDLVMATDSGYGQSMMKAAERYPDTKWVLLSNVASPGEFPKNFAAYAVNWCDYGYLAGATVGLIGEKKAATLTGMRIPASDQWDGTFEQGVKDVNPNMDVIVRKVGDWTDPGNAAEAASAVIGDGADVIWDTHTLMQPIAQRAQDANVWYVASHGAKGFAPKVQVATIDEPYAEVEKDIATQINGDKPFENTMHIGGMEEGMLTVTPLGLGFEDQQAKLDEIKEKLANGEVQYTSKMCQDGGR